MTWLKKMILNIKTDFLPCCNFLLCAASYAAFTFTSAIAAWNGLIWAWIRFLKEWTDSGKSWYLLRKGIEIGIEKAKRKMVINLIQKKGFEDAAIAELTETSIEFVLISRDGLERNWLLQHIQRFLDSYTYFLWHQMASKLVLYIRKSLPPLIKWHIKKFVWHFKKKF